ncbi:MAG: response regulator [Gemmatimonadales bacterium]|nr:response regulator [Gemmatimonadales bacterium]
MDEGSRQPKVLIANDQEWSARSLESIFAGEDYAVIRAFTGHQAIQKAAAALPDVIILDRQMPDLDGAEVCRRLRADPRFGATTPILITTAGQAGRAQRIEAFQAGAWDFIGQPIDGEAILCKVRTFLQAKRAAEHLQTDTMVDSTTGLYTREGMARRAREVASEATRHHQSVACVVFTPDVQVLQDAIHSIDEIAKGVARFFKESGRTADVVARLGPLEFAVIAPTTSAEGAARMVERIESALTAQSDGDGGRVPVRAGYFAVADFADEPVGFEEMIAKALASAKVTAA